MASREGLLSVAQSLCAFGCSVDQANGEGQLPLHLAARAGHTEVVRCLCLAGCKTDAKNREGMTPDIAALANGHGDVCQLLKMLKRVRERLLTLTMFANVSYWLFSLTRSLAWTTISTS